MLRLTSHIEIGTIRFTNVTDIEIDSSWENLTDTCKIKIPRKLEWGYKKVIDIIKRGDKILVRLGYDDKNTEVFNGYIRDIRVNSQEFCVEIDCEDPMYLLKKGELNKTYEKIDTDTLIKYIVGDKVPYKVISHAQLGSFRIKKATPAKVLEYLRSNYFMKSWCRGGILYVGLAYYPELQQKHIFDFNQNVIGHSLEFRLKEDVKISLKGVIMSDDNKKKEVKFGDDDGEQRTFHYHNKTESFVKAQLAQEYERLKYTGYRGSFEAFGAPQVNHGDVVVLRDKQYKEREGRYLVKKVVTKFGMNGFRQTIELEAKA